MRIPSVRVPEVEISAAQARAIREAAKSIEQLNTPQVRDTLAQFAQVGQNATKNLPQEQIQAARHLLETLQRLDSLHTDLGALQVNLNALEEAEKEENAWAQMENQLREKLEDGVAHVSKHEIEGIGEAAGLSRQAAVELFEDQKGVSWRGDYISSNEEEWIAAWIEDLY